VKVGVCFDSLKEIPELLEQVSECLSRNEYNFIAYQQARSIGALKEKLIGLTRK
jgi:hypothetical protein